MRRVAVVRLGTTVGGAAAAVCLWLLLDQPAEADPLPIPLPSLPPVPGPIGSAPQPVPTAVPAPLPPPEPIPPPITLPVLDPLPSLPLPEVPIVPGLLPPPLDQVAGGVVAPVFDVVNPGLARTCPRPAGELPANGGAARPSRPTWPELVPAAPVLVHLAGLAAVEPAGVGSAPSPAGALEHTTYTRPPDLRGPAAARDNRPAGRAVERAPPPPR